MLSKLNLRVRILGLVAALASLCLVGGLVSFWFTLQMNSFVKSIIDKDLVIMKAIEELDSSLVMQKGYLTYFFLDGDEKWLIELDNRDQYFNRLLGQTRGLTDQPMEIEVLSQIESRYLELTLLRNQVIDLYKDGRRKEGYQLHQQVRRVFFQIRDLSEDLKASHWARITQARTELLSSANQLARLSLSGVGAAVLLGALLAFLLVRQILRPIRRLAEEARTPDRLQQGGGNEVQALQEGVHHLIEDVDQVQSQLRVSQEHLIEASKMASVGKLAAGVAHSIRNPLTSVKMRLFSLEGNIKLNQAHQDDFQVISEEIRHIDNIVRNFLEFSRRPKLRMEAVSPSDVVDMTLTLLSHRLESFGVKVQQDRVGRLPDTEADPDQLREVLVNLMINACESTTPDYRESGESVTPGGGEIIISESEDIIPQLGPALVIQIKDNGPGIPPEIKDQVFKPFFTTKEEGTGLGLSIATRIIEEHGGLLEVESEPGQGTVFKISLPLAHAAGENGSGSAEKETSWTES